MTIVERKQLIARTAETLSRQIAVLSDTRYEGGLSHQERNDELDYLRAQLMTTAKLSLYTITEEMGAA